MSNNFSDFINDNSGASAIEFAILAPVFLFILFGLLSFGIYIGATNSIQQLAADAARIAVAGLNEAERIKLTERYIEKNGGNYVLIDPDNLRVSVADSAKDPSQFNVTVEYDATSLPVWNLYRGLPMPGKRIVRSATIRVGGI